jgi:membrane-bound serine protease (ClpP class)
MLKFLHTFFLFTLFIMDFSIYGAEPVPTFLSMQGYLGKEQLDEARKTVAARVPAPNQTILIEINSTSGDLVQMLDFAKYLFELRSLNQDKIVIYIEDNAIGPAAILPFLADELYISLLVSWGDIPLGNEKTVPTNLLRNRVLSLINPSSPKADILKLLSIKMSDPDVKVVDENGWKVVPGNQTTYSPVISEKGETMVINQNQMKQLGLVKESLTPAEFKKRFNPQMTESQMASSVPASAESLQVSPEKLMEKLKTHIKYNPQGPNTVGHIYIGDKDTEISQTTWIYVKSALDHYKETKPIFVILEINTPGGEVFAAENISDALKELDTQHQIPVVCFIDNWAMSAGAMLAYSCRFITVTKDASMGAAEPVIASETGEMKSASEKINSALRADFANRASFFDRNPYIAEKMVDKDIILVLRHGRIIKLDNENQIRSTGLNPDIVISPKGKLLTMGAEDLIKYGVADMLLLPVQLQPITAEEKEKGQWSGAQELLFHQPFFDQIPQVTIDSHRMDWRTRFFALLAHPVVSSLLFMGLMIGFYLEISSPGASLPGSIAAICLFLIILSSFAQEIGSALELILMLVGLATVLIELFVLPTFGLLGFFGLICFIAGLFGLMLPGIGKIHFEWDTSTFNAAGDVFFERLAWLSGAMILSMIIMGLLGRYALPSFSTFKRFVLSGNEQDASLGYVAGEDPALLPKPGTAGTVLATLRPAGKVILNDKIYDAMSDGNFIEKGEKIEVVRIEGSIIIVNIAKKEQS